MNGEHINIYECYDHNGNPVRYVCDGHVDSMTFREKCFSDFYSKPMVVRHQWQKTRKFVTGKPKAKRNRFITETIYTPTREMNSTPVTIGLMN